MTTELIATTEPFTVESPTPTFPTSDEAIEILRSNMVGLTAKTPSGYKAVKSALQELRKTRASVEERRVELKAGALEWGRKVDGEAKRLTAQLKEIESVLEAEKQAVDKAKEEERLAKEAEAREKIKAELEAKLAEQDAKFKAEREAEAERARTESERLRTEAAEQARKLQEETERLREESRRLREENERMAEEKARADAQRNTFLAEQARLQAEFESFKAAQFAQSIPPGAGEPVTVGTYIHSPEQVEEMKQALKDFNVSPVEFAKASEGYKLIPGRAVITEPPYHTKPPTVDNPIGVAVDCDPNVRYGWTTKTKWHHDGEWWGPFRSENAAHYDAKNHLDAQSADGEEVHIFKMRKVTAREIIGHNFLAEQLHEEFENNLCEELGLGEDTLNCVNFESLEKLIEEWTEENVDAWFPVDGLEMGIK